MTKRAIVLEPSGKLASAEIGHASAASVLVGCSLVVVAEMDFGAYGLVVAGDMGMVTYVNQESGEVQITLARYIPDMASWENTITLMPFESDDLLKALRIAAPSLCSRVIAR